MPAKIGLKPKQLKAKINDVYKRNPKLTYDKVRWCFMFCYYGIPAYQEYRAIANFLKNKKVKINLPLLKKSDRDRGMTYCFLLRQYLDDSNQIYSDLAIILYHGFLTGYHEDTPADINIESLKEIEKRYSSIRFLDKYEAYKKSGGDNPFLVPSSYYEFIKSLRLESYSFEGDSITVMNKRNINRKIERVLQYKIQSFKKKLAEAEKVEFFEWIIQDLQKKDYVSA